MPFTPSPRFANTSIPLLSLALAAFRVWITFPAHAKPDPAFKESPLERKPVDILQAGVYWETGSGRAVRAASFGPVPFLRESGSKQRRELDFTDPACSSTACVSVTPNYNRRRVICRVEKTTIPSPRPLSGCPQIVKQLVWVAESSFLITYMKIGLEHDHYALIYSWDYLLWRDGRIRMLPKWHYCTRVSADKCWLMYARNASS